MTSLSILTPSYSPDFELCRRLQRSVLEHTEDDVHHYIVVPPHETDLFAELAGPRCTVVSLRSVLPRRFLTTGLLSRAAQRIPRLPPSAQIAALNLRRPYPPVRGWVLQQLIKLHMAARLGSDVVLLVDSDVELIRPVEPELFRRDGATVLYRVDGAVTAGMPDHLRWHAAARRLLHLPPPGAPPLDDYISPFLVWDGEIVRALQRRLQELSGRPWLDLLGGQLHISEAILYGTFAESGSPGSPAPPVTADSHCHCYWPDEPLSLDAARRFVEETGPDDVAVMISAKSRTPLDVRRYVLDRGWS